MTQDQNQRCFHTVLIQVDTENCSPSRLCLHRLHGKTVSSISTGPEQWAAHSKGHDAALVRSRTKTCLQECQAWQRPVWDTDVCCLLPTSQGLVCMCFQNIKNMDSFSWTDHTRSIPKYSPEIPELYSICEKWTRISYHLSVTGLVCFLFPFYFLSLRVSCLK